MTRSRPQLLGIAGQAGAGKDTVFDRLAVLGGPAFRRFSIADPMKESIAALFDVSLEMLEEIKRNPTYRIILTAGGASRWADFTMREFMQRYGTESHREIFGEDFWLDHWLQQVEARNKLVKALMGEPATFVNTSVRFPNEAYRIIECGGEVWQVDGPQDEGAGGHPSEALLPANLITRTIDNASRYKTLAGEPNFNYLDDQLALILDEWNTER